MEARSTEFCDFPAHPINVFWQNRKDESDNYIKELVGGTPSTQ